MVLWTTCTFGNGAAELSWAGLPASCLALSFPSLMVHVQPISIQKCELLELLTSSSIVTWPSLVHLSSSSISRSSSTLLEVSHQPVMLNASDISTLIWPVLGRTCKLLLFVLSPSSELVSRADGKYSSHPFTLTDTNIRLPIRTSSSASLRRVASCVCSCFIHNQLANLITAWWRAIRFPVSPTLVLPQNWGHPSLIYEAITCNVMKSPSDQDLCRWN